MITTTFKRTLSALTLCFIFTDIAVADDIQVFFNAPVNAPALQTNLETKIVGLIDSATTSIDIAVYDADLPAIADALVRAKNQRNVTIRLVTDNDNVGGQNQAFQDALDAAGIAWLDDTADGSAGSGLQHNKWIVVDGRHVLMGSTNFTQSGVLGDLDANGNLVSNGNDNHILLIDSIELATEVNSQMNYMWGDGPAGQPDSMFGLTKPDHTLTTVYTTNDNIRMDVLFTPQSKSNYQGSGIDITAQYVANSGADSEIDFAQFVISSQDIADAAEGANNTGATVRGIGDPSFFFRYYSEFQDMLGQTVTDASTGRVEVEDSFTGAVNNPWQTPAEMYPSFHLDGGDKWHHKYIRVDDTVLTGSHNSSGAASFTNDETILIVYDAETASEFKGHFDLSFCRAKQAYTGIEQNCTQLTETPVYEGGTWDGVTLTGEEVTVILDMVNNASFVQLDDDVGLNRRAATNIVDARDISSLDQLAGIAFVGKSALTTLQAYVDTWNVDTPASTPTYEGGTWEGVTFTGEEVAVIIDIVNNATLTELDDEAAMNARAAQNIINARAIESMDQLAAIAYIGNAAMVDLYDFIDVWLAK
jgi:phosphatidylserine/phosphatidylglycerophosphate/cardiolipin synthase-like enzyme/DNA uptake protein ComE-like DNA-binding protein